MGWGREGKKTMSHDIPFAKRDDCNERGSYVNDWYLDNWHFNRFYKSLQTKERRLFLIPNKSSYSYPINSLSALPACAPCSDLILYTKNKIKRDKKKLTGPPPLPAQHPPPPPVSPALAQPPQQKALRMDPSSFDIRCPACGSAHPNPALCETYRYCQNCSSVMREASAIDMKKIPKPAGRLLVIAASYGHPDDASKAIDVRETLQRKIEGHGAKDCLNITPQDDLLKYFGLKHSPCGGKKCIRVRFLIEGRRSETIGERGRSNFLLFVFVLASTRQLTKRKCEIPPQRSREATRIAWTTLGSSLSFRSLPLL